MTRCHVYAHDLIFLLFLKQFGRVAALIQVMVLLAIYCATKRNE